MTSTPAPVPAPTPLIALIEFKFFESQEKPDMSLVKKWQRIERRRKPKLDTHPDDERQCGKEQ